jgi:hypothetical protein
MKKWKAAKVSWASFNEGSEKMALFVKTWSIYGLASSPMPSQALGALELTMPIVANVFTTIHAKDDLAEAWGTVWAGFSCSAGSISALSSSSPSPSSKSSGDFSLTKLPSVSLVVPCFSFSFTSYASVSVTDELVEGARSVDRSAIVAEGTGRD